MGKHEERSMVVVPSSRGHLQALPTNWPRHIKHLYVCIYMQVYVWVSVHMQVRKTNLAYCSGIYEYSIVDISKSKPTSKAQLSVEKHYLYQYMNIAAPQG